MCRPWPKAAFPASIRTNGRRCSARPGLPAPIVARLHAALAEALADAGVKQRLAQIGAVPVGSAPADFARFVREGREQMATLVREAGIRLD